MTQPAATFITSAKPRGEFASGRRQHGVVFQTLPSILLNPRRKTPAGRSGTEMMLTIRINLMRTIKTVQNRSTSAIAITIASAQRNGCDLWHRHELNSQAYGTGCGQLGLQTRCRRVVRTTCTPVHCRPSLCGGFRRTGHPCDPSIASGKFVCVSRQRAVNGAYPRRVLSTAGQTLS